MTILSRNNTLRFAALACALALQSLSALPAAAQDAEAGRTHAIKLIVPYAAGGFADTRVRRIAKKMSDSLGQPVVVDNRAGGVTGTNLIAQATDGHTFGFASPAPMTPASRRRVCWC